MSDISTEVGLAGLGVAISVGGLIVAGWAAYTAHQARRAAERSATAAENSSVAAERSANAAEQSVQTSMEALELQRQAAAAQAEERHRRQLADVVPVKWESRNNQASGAGLVVTNRGPGVASDVRADCLVAQLYRAGEIASLTPGQTIGFRDELKDFKPSSEEVGELPEPRADGEYVARVIWTNEDGSSGETGWRRIPRF